MAAETDGNKKTPYRKPGPIRWAATSLVLTYAVWCVLLSILTASGHLLNSQSFECGNSDEDESRLKSEASLVYLWSGLSLPLCIVLLLNIWIRKSSFWVSLGAIVILFVVMVVSFSNTWEKESEEMEVFKASYLVLRPLRHKAENTQTDLNDKYCPKLSNVYRWQAEFKCCGLESYQEWWSTLPDSCLCEGAGNGSGCVGVGNSLVYEKPCLPTVLSLLAKRSSAFWIVMIVWMTVIGAPVALFSLVIVVGIWLCIYWFLWEPCYYKLRLWQYRMSGGEEIVPVVFIRKDNNNQKEEESKEWKDGEAEESRRDEDAVVDMEGGTSAEGDGREAAEDPWPNAMTMIPLSKLRTLQEELDQPPVQHQVRCLCISPSKPKNFYIVMIEEGSPLLPSNAVLADANKPTMCLWAEGPHVFAVEHIVWPKQSIEHTL